MALKLHSASASGFLHAIGVWAALDFVLVRAPAVSKTGQGNGSVGEGWKVSWTARLAGMGALGRKWGDGRLALVRGGGPQERI